MTSMLCGLVCVVLLSGLTALVGGLGQSESVAKTINNVQE